MKRSGWMAGARALAATTALACAAMVASSAARADLYNYTFSQTGAFGANFTGTFNATITGIGSSISSASSISITNGTGFTTYNAAPITSVNGSLSFSNGTGTFSGVVTQSDGKSSSGAVGPVSGTSSAFSFGNTLIGLFSAVDSGPSGGGGGGGGGGSGGAPTPEVNAGLGILIAGASFAFLRRKRHKPLTA